VGGGLVGGGDVGGGDVGGGLVGGGDVGGGDVGGGLVGGGDVGGGDVGGGECDGECDGFGLGDRPGGGGCWGGGLGGALPFPPGDSVTIQAAGTERDRPFEPPTCNFVDVGDGACVASFATKEEEGAGIGAAIASDSDGGFVRETYQKPASSATNVAAKTP
jgi:hypothetical protein